MRISDWSSDVCSSDLIDYGAKRNIFRNLVRAGAKVTVLPATATFEDVMKQKPAGVFLSNGPGDPAATGEYAVPVIQKLLAANIPIFGICLGHPLLGPIGRAHVCTPVTNAHIVCRLLLEKTQTPPP